MGYIYVIKYKFPMGSQKFPGNPKKLDDVAIVFPVHWPFDNLLIFLAGAVAPLHPLLANAFWAALVV